MLDRLNLEQRKLIADLLQTLSKLFLGGGLAGTFLNQVNIGWASIAGAILLGIVLHAFAVYIVGERKTKDDT